MSPRVTRHDDLVEAVFEDVSIDWRPAGDGLELGWAKVTEIDVEPIAKALAALDGDPDDEMTGNAFDKDGNFSRYWRPRWQAHIERAYAFRAALAQSSDRIVGVRWRDDGSAKDARIAELERERDGAQFIIDEIALALESRGYAHFCNGASIGTLLDENACLTAAEARADKAEQDLARLTVNAGQRLDERDARIAELEAQASKCDGFVSTEPSDA